MITYDARWTDGREILPEHREFPVRQVYVWVQADAEKVVLVSKNGEDWQFPGGKPEPGETAPQTAVREAHEETGIDLHDQMGSLRFFGYRIVTERDGDKAVASYLQVRYRILMDFDKDKMSTTHEDTLQTADDTITFVENVTIAEACRRIPWLKDSDEFRAFRALRVEY